MRTLPAHFWSKIDHQGDCWTWTGCKSPDGYGRFLGGEALDLGGSRMAHRVSYTVLRGDIETGLEIDHLCQNRACVNPWHMEPVTHQENVRRAWERATECRNGHPYTAETRVSDYQGGFRCLICRRKANRESIRRLRLRRKLAAEAS